MRELLSLIISHSCFFGPVGPLLWNILGVAFYMRHRQDDFVNCAWWVTEMGVKLAMEFALNARWDDTAWCSMQSDCTIKERERWGPGSATEGWGPRSTSSSRQTSACCISHSNCSWGNQQWQTRLAVQICELWHAVIVFLLLFSMKCGMRLWKLIVTQMSILSLFDFCARILV